MTKETFTRNHYVCMWETILSSYQWWGHDLITLLANIKKTNPIAVQTFNLLYKKNGKKYLPVPQGNAIKFYQKVNSLLPQGQVVNTTLEVKALRAKNESLEVVESVTMNRYDYLIAIICFMEEFLMLSIKDEKVSSNRNILAAHSDAVNIFMEKDNKTNVTMVRITIPCELVIEYSCKEKVNG